MVVLVSFKFGLGADPPPWFLGGKNRSNNDLAVVPPVGEGPRLSPGLSCGLNEKARRLGRAARCASFWFYYTELVKGFGV